MSNSVLPHTNYVLTFDDGDENQFLQRSLTLLRLLTCDRSCNESIETIDI